MTRFAKTFALLLGSALIVSHATAASTPGGAKLTATINDLGAKSGASHYTVVWVTKADNTFVTTLWKQGKADFAHSNWSGHFPTWNTQRAGSTALPAAPDGYTSATAISYAATNPSPPASGIASNAITITWNGKDSLGNVMPDATYKFWIEYAEDVGSHGTDTGGLTTGGLSWVKGPASSTVNPTHASAVGSPVGGLNFTNMSIVWTPSTVPPVITSAVPPTTGVQGVAYNHTITATGSTPITYTVTAGALPPPLTLSSGGIISGTPTTAGLFTGTITASNGTLPNATQNFSINIAQAIVITSAAPPASGNVGTPYSHTMTATGSGTISYQVISGGLPTGLTLTTAGVISGTPQAIGTFTGVIQASNGVAANVTQNFSIVISGALVYTPGTVNFTTSLTSLGSTDHWSVVWITKADGTFVKTIDIRGNLLDFWDVHWNDHCTTWYAARGASTALDGFSSATSTSYAAPLVASWNGRDANNNLMPDGNYKIWAQYAEDIDGVPGPVTTNGLTWTKGTSASSTNPAIPGGSFTNVSVVWTPVVAAAPEIAVEQPLATNLADGGAKDFGTVILGSSASLTFTVKNTGNADLTGLTITQDGTHSADFSISALPVAPVSGPSGLTTFIVQFTPSGAGARSAAIHLASNDGDENPFDLTLTGTGISAFDSWAAGAGLGAGADPIAMPKGDGVSNLEKFAFNLDASKADVRRLVVGGGGLTGLPGTTLIAGPTLRLEYLRRKASSNPGITYVAQFGSDLTGWTPATGTPTSIDDTWERVVVDDAPPVGSTKRFGRVVVSQP